MMSDEESNSDSAESASYSTESESDYAVEEHIDIESVDDEVPFADPVTTLQCVVDDEEEEEQEESGEWSFETDYVILKNNQTYQELIKTVVTLQAQRVQMVKDLETLLEVKEQALNDPMAFVKKMERRESLGIPPRLDIAKIPEINWSQYNITPQGVDGPATRGFNPKVPDIDQEEEAVRVRGRTFNESKPETFNQLWTSEEQQRLEELLVEFPPEERESRRWSKIAAALGNRTKNQVTSRVQKYFIKLQRAGLPVPGRVPRSVGSVHRHAHQRYNHHLFRPTTFFPSHPCMSDTGEEDEDEDEEEDSSAQEGGSSEWSGDSESSESEDETMQISEKVAEASASRVIRLLERVAEDKEKDVEGMSIVRHTKYKCDYCEEEPLLGTRWHCSQCSMDYCSDCVVTQLDSEFPHPSDHYLESFRLPNDR